jgi:hypothetical protein
MLDQLSQPLPAAALYPATLILFVALIYAMSRTSHASGKFLIAIVWLRYVMQAFHEITYAQPFGGVSINALVSLGVCAVGAFMVWPRLGQVLRFPFVLALIGVIVISGVLNERYSSMFETVIKWGYFFVVALCLYDCIQRDRDARIFQPLLWAFAPPLVLQAISIALGVSKASESDNSVSFIGGFSHEAAFSIVLVTCFTVASLAPRLNPALRIGLLLACVAGIVAANYRTSLLALGPLAIGYFTFSTARSFTPNQRVLIGAIAFIGMIGVALGASWLLRERLADITTVATSGDSLIKPPTAFTEEERRLFSGRLYLWSSYISAYLAGDDLRILFGFGPDSWIDVFRRYAHNTVISYLYEFGVFGALFILLVWVSMFWRASRISDPWMRGQLQFAHVGFIVLNLATMPFWQLEGLILYGLLCGYTLAFAPVGARRRSIWVAPPQPAAPVPFLRGDRA